MSNLVLLDSKVKDGKAKDRLEVLLPKLAVTFAIDTGNPGQATNIKAPIITINISINKET